MAEQQQYLEVRLYSRDEIYLPIWEEESAALEVQIGCSWHRCKFCDFANDPYHIFSLPEIEAKAQMLAGISEGKTRVFLLGENPLSLPMDHLRGIFDAISFWMPQASEVAMYARFDDVMRKTDAELGELKEHGLVEVHIGLESGSQRVLDFLDKGIAIPTALQACQRLRRIGIDYSFTMMAGAGGQALSDDHVRESVVFLNATQPKRVWITGMLIWQDTPLAQMAKDGRFSPCTFRQRLVEVFNMVAGLRQEDCTFVDSTVMGQYTIKGHLPEQRDGMLAAMRQVYAQPGGDEVSPVVSRKG